MDTITTAGPDVPRGVGVDAVGEADAAVGEDTSVGEEGVIGDVVGVDCCGAGRVCGEVLGACVGYVEGFEVW